jgi:hypothetical protein
MSDEIDPHKVRMAAANGAMNSLQAFDDDEFVALLPPFFEHMQAVIQRLHAIDAPIGDIRLLVVGMVLSAVGEQCV